MPQAPTAELFDRRTKRSIVLGAILMFVLNALLFWLPLLGPLVAGIVGGKVAGGTIEGMLAALVPSLLIGLLLFTVGSAISGIALVGLIAGTGGALLALSNVGLLIVGGFIGGLLAD